MRHTYAGLISKHCVYVVEQFEYLLIPVNRPSKFLVNSVPQELPMCYDHASSSQKRTKAYLGL